MTHARKAQQRLPARFHQLLYRKRPQIVAVARELVGSCGRSHARSTRWRYLK